MDRETREGMKAMCNLSDGLVDEAMEEGVAKGREEGREEGRAKGRFSSLVESAKNVMSAIGCDKFRASGMPTGNFRSGRHLSALHRSLPSGFPAAYRCPSA